ncbi:MAG TPA: hypothetical protein VG938_15850 [Verrucomicrobiae bacterium]|nr:hypothetical protein [Verrucomicrobiae bacterium]
MGPLNTRKFAVIALLLACTAAQTRGDGVYLRKIGPSPLRFSLATASFSFALPQMLREQSAVTNSPEAEVANPSDTNVVASQLPLPSATNNVPDLTNPNLPKNPLPGASASDLLVVSPQMLTEFFKPGTNGTNSPGATAVPAPTAPVAPIGFTPPLVMPPSSQAIYKSQ